MTAPVPLRFRPVFRRYLWGGRRLETVLGKTLPPGNDYAESWEVVDHGPDQSEVAAGPMAGATLGQLVREHSQWLLGSAHQANRFPLLLKYLDCHQNLSVQVHPDDARAARLQPPDLGKTEAWYILNAAPGAKVYAGLKQGVDRTEFENALHNNRVESLLHSFEPQKGDCIFIPAGAVHALGAGLLVAEIQQASDTTYRLFDWNRIDAKGNPRALHLKPGLEASDYELGPIGTARPCDTNDERVKQLVACDKFILNQIEIENDSIPIGGDGRFHLLTVVRGACQIEDDPCGQPLKLGQSALIPAACRLSLSASSATVLESRMP